MDEVMANVKSETKRIKIKLVKYLIELCIIDHFKRSLKIDAYQL